MSAPVLEQVKKAEFVSLSTEVKGLTDNLSLSARICHNCCNRTKRQSSNDEISLKVYEYSICKRKMVDYQNIRLYIFVMALSVVILPKLMMITFVVLFGGREQSNAR
jgi:hypothetical protein